MPVGPASGGGAWQKIRPLGLVKHQFMLCIGGSDQVRVTVTSQPPALQFGAVPWQMPFVVTTSTLTMKPFDMVI